MPSMDTQLKAGKLIVVAVLGKAFMNLRTPESAKGVKPKGE